MSWRKKDWLNFAGLLGLGATGFGLAGVGPLAGMLGPSALGTATGAAGMGELASVGATGSTMLGESLGLPGLLGGAGKGLDVLARAHGLMQLAGGGGQGVATIQAPRVGQMAQGNGADYLKRIYGGLS